MKADTATAQAVPSLRIIGAKVILPDGVETTDVWLARGRIVSIGQAPDTHELTGAGVEPAPSVRWADVDGRGRILAPALIDVHGDAFERQLMPRPGVTFPMGPALLETDRQLASNGIATAFHALTISWEPGLRSLQNAMAFDRTIEELRPRLGVDHRLQLRWETFAHDAIDFVSERLQRTPRPSLAFNDHTSMLMLDSSIALQSRPFDQEDDYPTVNQQHPAFLKKLQLRAERSQLSVPAYLDILNTVWESRSRVPAGIDHLAAIARSVGAPMLSHDDSQHRTRDYYRARGAQVAEFPMQQSVAERAINNGDRTVFGAPNVVRGGSHIGSPAAADMVASGHCHMLASDYHYPALLLAMAALVRDRVKPLEQLWKMVSSHPADAMRLEDRGTLQPGKRADIVLLDWPDGGEPVPLLTLQGGQFAHARISVTHAGF